VYISNYRQRSKAVFLVFLIFLSFSIARLLYIQFFRASYLRELAKRQHNLFVELEPRRGSIYDTLIKPQALNISVDSVYVAPQELKSKERVVLIERLPGILGVSEAFVRERLSRKKSFVWLARKISVEQSDAIQSLHLKAIGLLKESKRSYPNSYLGSHVLGFAGLDNVGLEGLELYYERALKGEPGWAMFLRDARQKRLDLWENMFLPKDGYEVVLTIDEVIQYIAERELDKVYKAYRAKGASIIVMNPHTGAILALANRPTYDLNERSSADRDKMRNRAICDLFEPGSVFKIVTASAALEEKTITEEDKIFCENGAFRVASHILHDHRPHGWLTFREVIEQSSNIGTTKVAQMLGPDTLWKYIRLFGFGDKTGIDLPGEISGMAKEPSRWSKISIAAIPIGQEIGVTSLQLVRAVSVIANGGQLMKPYIVKEIRDKYGQSIKKFSAEMVHKVISLDTANRIKKILAGVVEEGTGKRARIPGFTAAGKTGTAQKLEPNGTYSHSKYIASFIGFAPVEDPLVAIVVIVDDPRPYYFGGVVAAPVFKNVAQEIIRYLRSHETEEQVLASYETLRSR